MYAFGEKHENLSLQHMLAAVVQDLKGLVNAGVPSKDYGATGLSEELLCRLWSCYLFFEGCSATFIWGKQLGRSNLV